MLTAIHDWRDLTPLDVAPLYGRERGRWLGALGWDVQGSQALVEEARQRGQLPGFVHRDPTGRITGWTFYVLHGDVLQIGALCGSSARAVRGLLEAVLDSPEAAMSRELWCHVFPEGTAVRTALARRRFLLRPQLYLTRRLDGSAPEHEPRDGFALRPWAPSHAASAVRLLARAYGSGIFGRSFAPHGRVEEWAHYLTQLMRTPSCGTLLPEASFFVEERATRRALGVIVTTRVGDRTAHIAQMAVDPTVPRLGLGRWLVSAACGAAARLGCAELTLIVDAANDPACGLYHHLQFTLTQRLLFARRPTPVRRNLGRGRAA